MVPYWIWWSQKRLRKVDYRRDLEFELLIASVAVAHGGVQVSVELGDDVEGDLFGAGRGALADVGAGPEAFGVVLGEHRDNPQVSLGLDLWELSELGDLRCEEEGGG